MARLITTRPKVLRIQKVNTIKNKVITPIIEEKPIVVVTKKEENKIQNIKEEVMMTTQEKINAAASILDAAPIKKIKKDKGLIERTESSMTILTEDNKELLKD